MVSPKLRVVLTGAGGFIGSAIAAELLERGIPVLAVQRPSSSAARLRRLDGLYIERAPSLADPTLRNALQAWKPTTFIHSAWRGVGGADRNEPWQIAENVPMTLAAVNLAADAGCRQWIGLGSQAEYGNANRRLDEKAPCAPTTLYGRAKLAASVAAPALAHTLGMSAAWLRIFSTYGPGDAGNWFVPQVIRAFLAGEPPRLTRCEQRWDYLHVADAARAVAAVIAHGPQGVFNLGSGSAVPLRDIVEMIRVRLGTSIVPAYGAVPYRPDQVMHLEADISRLRTATGWTPRISLEEGIAGCIEHLLASAESASVRR